MTDSVDELLATRGYVVERFVTRSDARAIAIATKGAERHLVSILAPLASADRGPVAARAPWDLDLVEASTDRAGPEPWLVMVERLPTGLPTTVDDAASIAVPAFARTVADDIAAAHAAGQLVGPLHPALVFIDPVSAALVGCAQRPLRVAAGAVATDVPAEGQAPLFAASYRTRGELAGDAPSAADDVFRLAALIWRWRHGVDPFGAGLDELQGIASGIPRAAPTDDLDRTCLRAFAPNTRDGPRASDLVSALRAFDGPWSVPRG